MPEEAKASDDVDALRSRERSLQDELATINDEISQIEKSKALFDRCAWRLEVCSCRMCTHPDHHCSYAANVLNPVITPKTASGGDGSVSVPDLDFVSTLLDAHTSKNKAAANALRALKARASTANDAISTVRAQLAAKGATVRTVTQASRDATVVIAGTAPGKVSLQFIYMVSGASWKPSYGPCLPSTCVHLACFVYPSVCPLSSDIRISSAESSLELTYYGLITQSSGEDWNEALLVCATPSHDYPSVLPFRCLNLTT